MRLVSAAEIVPDEIECEREAMVLKLFGERICQSREAPHAHTHGEVLTLNIGRTDMLRIGTAVDLGLDRADANRGL
jgi:hypothetical protein